MDVAITVLIHNQRLALDKSALPTNLPADIFELMPPDSLGRWEFVELLPRPTPYRRAIVEADE